MVKGITLPRNVEEPRKEQSSGSCSKNIFVQQSQSRSNEAGIEKNVKNNLIPFEEEVGGEGSDKEETVAMDEIRDVESVAKSLGAVMISKVNNLEVTRETGGRGRKKESPKWKWKKAIKPKVNQQARNIEVEMCKRQLGEISVTTATPMEIMDNEKKETI